MSYVITSRADRKSRAARQKRTTLALLVAASALVDADIALAQASCPWVGSNDSPRSKAAAVVSQMTLSEKIDMMRPSAGSTPLGMGYQQVTLPVPRLCVPSMILQGGIAGVRGTPAGTATQMPSPIVVGASFERSIAFDYGALEGEEAWTKGMQGLQAPYVNIARVPQSGRNSSTYGEDPFLAAEMSRGATDGMQSKGVWAVVQSFAAYSQEANRQTANVTVSDRVLRQIYMPPLHAALVEGETGQAGAAMCTYPSVNGFFSCESPYLYGILKNDWGYVGFNRTDASAVHTLVSAVNAGTDFFNPLNVSQLSTAVTSGQIPMARIDDAVTNILATMFRFGVFERTSTGAFDTNARTPGHVAKALAFAEQGTVLLKNAGKTLPLHTATVGSIAVIGANGGSGVVTTSSGSSAVPQLPANIVTPLQGIQAAAGPSVVVTYNDGGNLASAATAAAAANVAIVFVSQPAGEFADLASLALPGTQDSLITTVAQANPNTIVVIHSGGPVLMPWLNQVKAVLESWFPGEQAGNAVASILFGTVNPSGKLPITFPTSNTASPVGTPAQYPGVNLQIQFSEGLNVGYRGYEAFNIPPLFPFGFGLSYTNFEISKLVVTPKTSDGTHPILVQFFVENTGDRAGAEVPQVYVGLPSNLGEPPKRLVAFEKIWLNPGEKRKVQISIDPKAATQPFSYWDSDAHAWKIGEGAYQFYVGNSSANIVENDAVRIRTLGH